VLDNVVIAKPGKLKIVCTAQAGVHWAVLQLYQRHCTSGMPSRQFSLPACRREGGVLRSGPCRPGYPSDSCPREGHVDVRGTALAAMTGKRCGRAVTGLPRIRVRLWGYMLQIVCAAGKCDKSAWYSDTCCAWFAMRSYSGFQSACLQ
jgi:hypothetical protein